MTSQPISLYIDLEPGEVADLEVVASAALAWAAAIKEAAFVVDPFLEVRVELASGTEGSLSLNAILKSVRKAATDKNTIRTVVITALIWTVAETRDYTFGRILDWMTGSDAAEATQGLSQAEIEAIAKRVSELLHGDVAAPQVKKMYRELERDPSIKGVGATTKPGKRPDVIVPRQAFPAQAGHGEVREETLTRRTIPQSLTVTLIRPVLVEDSARRWRFKSGQSEFSANMKDQAFLQRLLSGTAPVPMVTGIRMDLEIETTEELRAGVWVPVQRDVVRVVRLVPPPRQLGLPLSPLDEDERDDSADGDKPSDGEPEPGAE